MAEAECVTLAEWGQRLNLSPLIEELLPGNPLLEDMRWRQGSDRTGHEIFLRSGLITAGNCRVRFGIGTADGWSLSVLNKRMQRLVFHGNQIERPNDCMGLSALYSSLDSSEVQNAVNVIDGGGKDQGSLFSVWLVGWGAHTSYGFFPPGTTCGISVHGPHRWDVGLAVVDWRYIVRVANVPGDAGSERLLDLLGRSLGLIPSLTGEISFAFYCNEAMAKRLPPRFGGIPVRAIASLDAPESLVPRSVLRLAQSRKMPAG